MRKKKAIKAILTTVLLFVIVYSRMVNLSWGLPYPMHPDERNIAMSIQSLKCSFTPVQTNVRRPVDLHPLEAIPDTALKDTEGKAELVNPRNPGEAVWFFVRDCFNPHFFAYGQLTVYWSYFLIMFMRMFTQIQGAITLTEAVMALRLLSAVSSIFTILLGYLTIKTIASHEGWNKGGISSWNFFLTAGTLLLFVWSPAPIQFAHFGTTESFLMLMYTLLTFLSVKFMYDAVPKDTYVFLAAATVGLAAAAKISSLVFMIVPFILLFRLIRKPFEWMFFILSGAFYTFVILLIFSPHNLISFPDFLGTLKYESDVALGVLDVFYTRSFKDTVPVLFQAVNVFPYSLGWPVYLAFLTAFFALPWKKRAFNVLRFAFIAYLIPTAFAYTKWTRFMAPVFPVMIVIAGTAIIWSYWRLLAIAKKLYMIPSSESRYRKDETTSTMNLSTSHHTKYVNPAVVRIYHILFFLALSVFLIPGIAFISIYEREDVRSTASRWIQEHVPQGSYVLSETANVVDIPIDPIRYSPLPAFRPETVIARADRMPYGIDTTSFNFYELDNPGETPTLQPQLESALGGADYIFIPSRRIYYNHTCYRDTGPGFTENRFALCEEKEREYPLVNEYYKNLINGSTGFTQVEEFTSYPTLSLFGMKLMEFPDEMAEETWTVFDHPVIRIFKRG